METSNHSLGAILLLSRKVFSLSKKKPITEWKTLPFSESHLRYPHDFEIRLVNAATTGKKLNEEFNELNLSWDVENNIRKIASNEWSRDAGLTDIALYVESLGLAIIVESYACEHKIVEVESLDALKKVVG